MVNEQALNIAMHASVASRLLGITFSLIDPVAEEARRPEEKKRVYYFAQLNDYPPRLRPYLARRQILVSPHRSREIALAGKATMESDLAQRMIALTQQFYGKSVLGGAVSGAATSSRGL
jgi:hypothetical protein